MIPESALARSLDANANADQVSRRYTLLDTCQIEAIGA